MMGNPLSAAITLNDTLLIDFGKTTDTTTGNWNNVAPATTAFTDPQTLLADLNRFSDGAATGVGLVADKIAGSSPNTAGIGGATITSVGSSASFSVSGTIPDSAQVDLSFWNSGTTDDW